MTTIGPMCLIAPRTEVTLGSNSIAMERNISSAIVNAMEQHFLMMKASSGADINIEGYSRVVNQFNQFLIGKSIKDDCNGASIEGESLRFMNSSADFLLLSGWFNAVKPVCIGAFKVSDSSSESTRRVPFLAILSKSIDVLNVISLESDFYDSELSGYDIDQNTGNIYTLMQKSGDLWLGVYQKDGQLLYNKQFGTCSSVSSCKLLGIHYSNVYDRIVILIKENEYNGLSIEGSKRSFSHSKSAYWSVLIHPTDGAHIHVHRIFHSTSDSLALPKIQFDSIGKSILLFTCQDNCYLNDNQVEGNIFLVQYDYIKTTTPFVNKFFWFNNKNLDISSIIIHSLSLERDLTINAIVTSFNSSYFIIDNGDRFMKADPLTSYLYRFRYQDGKIINVIPLSNSGERFAISSPSSLVDTNSKVTEQSAIFFSTNDKKLKVLTYQYFGQNHYNEYQYVSGTAYIDSLKPDKPMTKISGIRVCATNYADMVYGIGFSGVDGSFYFTGDYCSRPEMFLIDEDEYFTEIYQELYYQDLQCVQFTTNKKMINAGKCKGQPSVRAYVPKGLDIVNVRVTKGGSFSTIQGYIDFKFGIPKTYSCNVGWSGNNCSVTTCFGLNSSDPNVCSGKSRCIAPNTCKSCNSTELSQGRNCQSYGYYCPDSYSPFNERVCSGTGSCRLNGSCECFTGFYGSKCEIPAKCYGVSKLNMSICSGNGACYDTDKCHCNTGYFGSNCEIPICNGISANSSSVCLSRGSCVSANYCECKPGYSGNNCESFTCNGVERSSSMACSRHGYCTDIDTCVCSKGYFGKFCDQWTCNQLLNNDTNVCTGRGKCEAYNVCYYCNHSYGTFCESCYNGYFGTKCEKYTCSKVYSTMPNVCSGRGVCKSPDSCECNKYSHGSNCETCNTGYFGDLCSNWTCNGTLNSNESVCNGRGICNDYDTCLCRSPAVGKYCESCSGFHTGKTCSECWEGFYGMNCGYHLTNDTTPYIPYMENSAWVGFVVNIFTMDRFPLDLDKFMGCDLIIQDLGKLASSTDTNSIKCRVRKQTNYVYPVEVWIAKERAIFNPQDPIMFNIVFIETISLLKMINNVMNITLKIPPVYLPIKLDLSDFVNKYGNGNNAGSIIVSNARKYATVLNRCYENVISINFVPPDHGPIRSITWKLEGDSASLYENEIVKNAINKTQNTYSWTLPYFKELKSFSKIEMSVSIITNWNLTFTANAVFTIDGSFPKTFTYDMYNSYFINLKSRTFTVPIRTFFSENFECIDGRTMAAFSPNRAMAVEMTQNDIILKPKSFKSNIQCSVMFYDGSYIYFTITIETPTVYIKESVLSPLDPVLTIECNNIYGPESGGFQDVVWVMKGNTAVAKSIYTDPVRMDVRSFTPPLNTIFSQLLTVYCVRMEQQFVNSPLELFTNLARNPQFLINYRPGKSDRSISFSSGVADSSGCTVISVSFKTKIANLIPFSEMTTLDLEIITTKADKCKVDVFIVDSQGRNLLTSVNMPYSTVNLVPIQKLNNVLRSSSKSILIENQFILSAMGTGDVKDYSVSVNVQNSPFDDIYRLPCSITPKVIQIGLTEASMTCDTSLVTSSSIIWTLFLDGVSTVVGSFPLKFKPTKPVSRYYVMGTDVNSGGESHLSVNLNNVEYSTSYLSTGEALEVVSSELSKTTDDYHKKNDLVVTMISNINYITNHSVLDQISKIVPLALSATAKSLNSQLDKGIPAVVEMVKYLNQVKVLSRPQYLNQDSAMATYEVLNKFVNTSRDVSFWTSSSPQPLTDILVNVAANIPEQSLIQTSTSIVNAAISFGIKSDLATSDFYPATKPSNLIGIRAVKVKASMLKEFYIGNTKTPLISFNEVTSSNDSIVQVSNSLFKSPKSISRNSKNVYTRDFISYLSLSSMKGEAHLSIPITKIESYNFSSKQYSFRCNAIFERVNFINTWRYCNLFNTSYTQLTLTGSPQNVLLVDCLCDLSALSDSLQTSDSIVGITAEYALVKVNDETIPQPQPLPKPPISNDNSGNKQQKGDSSAVAAIILIPIFACCVCLIVIPATVVYILVREFKKREHNDLAATNNALESCAEEEEEHPYYRVANNSSSAFGFHRLFDNQLQEENQQPGYIAMKTFSSFSVTEELPNDINSITTTTV